jgi:hypothetical protein
MKLYQETTMKIETVVQAMNGRIIDQIACREEFGSQYIDWHAVAIVDFGGFTGIVDIYYTYSKETQTTASRLYDIVMAHSNGQRYQGYIADYFD